MRIDERYTYYQDGQPRVGRSQRLLDMFEFGYDVTEALRNENHKQFDAVLRIASINTRSRRRTFPS